MSRIGGSWLRVPFREIRAAPSKFVFVVVAVAIGVGALTGVRGFSEAFRGMLLSEARTMMAADLMIRVFDLPSDEQLSVMDSLAARGIDLQYGHDVEGEIAKLEKLIAGNSLAGTYPPRWLAVKLLEEDEEIVRKVRRVGIGQ